MKQVKPDIRTVWNRYQRGVQFNQQIGLYQTVEDNENMYIGKQWEGVQANGLPTPVFNLLKRVTMFQVATITSDNIAVRASALQATRGYAKKDVEKVESQPDEPARVRPQRRRGRRRLHVHLFRPDHRKRSGRQGRACDRDN